MDMLFSSFFWVTLWQIIMINILLSGDNAVVIALASRNLPPKQQKQAILFGSLGAIVLRVVLTFFAVMLLSFPYLKIVGGILLVWIGIKMLVPEDGEDKFDAHSGLWAAIKTIIIADFIMSLDNVLGVAAAAKGNTVLLVLGLVISIPLIIYGSTLILKLMERFGFIVVIGAGLLGWVAGEMLVTDPAIAGWIEVQAHWAHTIMPVIATLIVVSTGMWMARAAREVAPLAVAFPVDSPTATAAVAVANPAPVQHVADSYRVADFGQIADLEAMAAPAQDANVRAAAPSSAIASSSAAEFVDGPLEPAPVGYRWISSPWHTLPDGKRDYAALHGKQAFYRLVPESSHLPAAPRRRRI